MNLVAAFPLGTAFLPGDAVILRVFETRYLHLVHDISESSQQFLTVLIQAGSEVGGGDKRFDTGVMVAVDHVAPADDGLHLFGHAESIVDVVEWNDDRAYPRARVVEHHLEIGSRRDVMTGLYDVSHDIKALIHRVQTLGLSTSTYPHLDAILDVSDSHQSDDELWSSFWRLTHLVPCTPLDRYEFLRGGTLAERTARVRDSIAHINDLLTFRYG